MGIFDRGLATTQGLRALSRALSNLGSANEVHALWVASVLVGLLAAVVLYAGWCGGTSGAVKGLQFGLIIGVFVACIHPISNLVTMNMDTKLGLEITVSTAIGWVLAGLVIGLVYRPIAPLGIASR
jgi:hypothetical protein